MVIYRVFFVDIGVNAVPTKTSQHINIIFCTLPLIIYFEFDFEKLAQPLNIVETAQAATATEGFTVASF
jgi:hypothetical protein